VGEYFNEKRTRALMIAGLGAAAFAGYHLVKDKTGFKMSLGLPERPATMPADFQERLASVNDKVNELIEGSAAFNLEGNNELHKYIVPPVAFVFSESQERFAEIVNHGTSLSITIVPARKKEGSLKTGGEPTNNAWDGKGHQMYWGVTPTGIRTELYTFGSDGLEPEQALDRIHNLVFADDLELMSLDATLS